MATIRVSATKMAPSVMMSRLGLTVMMVQCMYSRLLGIAVAIGKYLVVR